MRNINDGMLLKQYFKKYQGYWKRRHKHLLPRRTGASSFEHLRSLWKKKAQGNILDTGCAEGYMSRELSKYGFVVGIDVCLPLLKKAIKASQGEIAFVWGLGEKLPLKDQSFDFVLCSEVIEHVLNDMILLTEIHRVMKKKSYLLISTPRKDSQGIYSIVKNAILKKWYKGELPFPYHLREYTVKDFTLTLKKAGFKLVKAIYDKPLLPDIPFRRTIHNRIFKIRPEQIFLCEKENARANYEEG